MVLHVFTSFLGGVPLCIPYGLYSGTSLGGTTWRTLGGYPGRVLSSYESLLCVFVVMTYSNICRLWIFYIYWGIILLHVLIFFLKWGSVR